MTNRFNRRSLLKGVLSGGAAVTLGLPMLDQWMNAHGETLASGAPIPTRFGTYFWGLGLTDTPAGGSRWVPRKVGYDYDIMPELETFAPLKDKVSVFSGFRVIGDGRPNLVHWSGHAAILGGGAPEKTGQMVGPSFDNKVADAIGATTRFRKLDIAPCGDPKANYSTRTGKSFATPETTPLDLYMRLFGEGFQDPNDPNWKPNPDIMLRKSVLSAVGEQRRALMADVGRNDQIKLDQYFTSLREIENQLAMQLEKPAEAEACAMPKNPGEGKNSITVDVVNQNTKVMSKLLAMGLACNQTRVFNMVHTPGTSTTYVAGEAKTYHQITHDEPTDAELGYQPETSRLAGMVMEGFGIFLKELDAIQEGNGTVLDNSLVMAFSDTGYAKIHSLENIPVFFAGRAGGRHKAGYHVASKGEPISRLSLTAMELAGASPGEFGEGAMKTSKLVEEVIAKGSDNAI
ncbi:MAG: hypothetical protein CMK06_08285 [Ponticaulis sp.]|nr:hypothetical protein [Ponticaulis sp.]|tara:strand:+ start:33728 stop:35104 length:1377 start_codon:yes stop_codon:yes gene_type:complete